MNGNPGSTLCAEHILSNLFWKGDPVKLGGDRADLDRGRLGLLFLRGETIRPVDFSSSRQHDLKKMAGLFKVK